MKTCRVCGLTSDNLDLFVKSPKCKEGRENRCKECFNQQGREHKKARRDLIDSWKEDKPCSICNQVLPPYVLDYHHLDGLEKDASIAGMISGNAPIERIQQEIDKCILICSNCHRIIHYQED